MATPLSVSGRTDGFLHDDVRVFLMCRGLMAVFTFFLTDNGQTNFLRIKINFFEFHVECLNTILIVMH